MLVSDFRIEIISLEARRSSMVELMLMGQWITRLISHGCLEEKYFSGSVLHRWCNKGQSMCYPVCGIVHMKIPGC